MPAAAESRRRDRRASPTGRWGVCKNGGLFLGTWVLPKTGFPLRSIFQLIIFILIQRLHFMLHFTAQNNFPKTKNYYLLLLKILSHSNLSSIFLVIYL